MVNMPNERPRTLDDLTVAIENAAAHRAETAAQRTAAQRTYDAAKAARDQLGYVMAGVSPKVQLRILRAEEVLEDAEARLAECRRIAEVAQTQHATLLRRAYHARHRDRLETERARVQAQVDALAEDHADQVALAQALGVVAVEGQPLAMARQLVRVLDAELRSLTPASRAPVAPRPGYVRVKALTKFTDREGRVHWPDAGAVDELPAEDLSVVVENRWAAVVEVGG